MLTIEKIEEIDSFKYFNNEKELGILKIKSEITFPSKVDDISENKIVSFYSDKCKKEIRFGINHDNFNTVFFQFEEKPFERKELIELSKLFSFKVEPHKLHPEILIGSLGFFHKDYSMKCYGAIQVCNSINYLIIYATRRSKPSSGAAEDYFGDDVCYIHMICEVEFHEEFKKKFGLN